MDRSKHSLVAISERLCGLFGGENEYVWPALELNARLVVAVVLGAMGACLSSAGGVGGGGLYVPLFNLLVGFDAKTAAALSNFMIFGGGVSNLGVTVRQVHPEQAGRPMVDYDAALMLLPNMLLGISLGVICNVVFPAWLITALLAVTLTYMTSKSLRGAIRRWASETRKLEEESGFRPCADAAKDVQTPLLVSSNAAAETQSLLKTAAAATPLRLQCPWGKLATLVFVWLVFFAVQVLRDSQSWFNVQPCGLVYWLLTASQVPIALAFTFWIAHSNAKPRYSTAFHEEEQATFAQKAGRLLPALALLAGVLGGMLGIGGGMILNPVLLDIGMHPQVTAATVVFLIFFAASMSVVQFWLLGRIPLSYALLFAAISLVFSFVGQILVQRLIAKYGRPSIVVFTVSGVIGLSAIAMATFGGFDIVRTYLGGGYMGFHTPC